MHEQKLYGKLYLCRQFFAHQLSSGNPVSRSHTCDDTSITTAIRHYLSTNPEAWTAIPWACLYCGRDNLGTDPLCTNTECDGEMGAGRDYVFDNILSKIGQEISLMDEANEQTSEIWPIQMVARVLLSPHNRVYCGLLTGAFRSPQQGENICACCPTTTTTSSPPCHTNPSTLTPPLTAHTTTSPPPISTSSLAPPPAPAPFLGPLQALFVDETVMEEAMDTTATIPLTQHQRPSTPMDDQDSEDLEESKRIRLDPLHQGTNGLLTCPRHSTTLDHLPRHSHLSD